MQVASLHIHPVKSLGAISCSSFYCDPWGPEHDRRWVVVDHEKRFLTQRNVPEMATIQPTLHEGGLTLCHNHGDVIDVAYPSDAENVSVRVWKSDVRACDEGDQVAEWLSQRLGRLCRLVYMDAPDSARVQEYEGQSYTSSFADGFPGLICTQASLDDLNTRLQHPVPMARFRPNIVISGTLPWAEDHWQYLAVGEAILKVVKPCSRCIITTIDQQSGDIPNRGQPLKTLGQFRRHKDGIMFGQNILVVQPGRIQVSDTVRCL